MFLHTFRLLLLLLCSSVWAGQPDSPFSPEEEQWRAKHATVKLCYSNDFPPNLFLDKKGKPAGYIPELYALLGEKLGIEFKFEISPWPEAVDNANQRKCAGLALVRKLDQWRKNFALSDELFYTYSYLYARSDQFPAMNTLHDLKGKKLAYLRGEIVSEMLIKKYPGITGVPFDNVESSITALGKREVDAIIGTTGIDFKRQQNHDSTFKIAAVIPESKAEVVIAIRKDWPELMALLNKGLSLIAPDELRALEARWFSVDPQASQKVLNINLDVQEKNWLLNAPKIRVKLTDFPPFSMTTPEPAGITVDYLNLIAENTGLEVEYITDSLNRDQALLDIIEERSRYDLILNINKNSKLAQATNVSSTVAAIPLVVITRRENVDINSMQSMQGKTLTLVRGGALADRIRSEHPNINILWVDKVLDALQALSTGRADAYIGNLIVANYLMREQHIDNLMVVAPAPYDDLEIAIAVRKDWTELSNIINKGLASITPTQRNQISQKWGSVEFKSHVDYGLLWKTGAAATAILLLFLMWNRSLSREINRRLQIENELRQAKETADQANRAKGEFLANMSHEIRTPLNSVIGLAYLLEKDPPPDERKELIQNIHMAGNSLLGIVNNVLDLAKIEAGELEMENKPIQLKYLFKEVEQIMQASITAKKLKLSIAALPAGCPDIVMGDITRVRQILINLIGNAIKFTEKGSITVHALAIEPTASNSIRLKLVVQDTGIGIAADVLPKLFSPFTQADSSTTRQFGGTGLGLTIVKQLAEKMGGCVAVESELGVGTRFTVEVQFRKPSEEDLNLYAQSQQIKSESLEGIKVLVVDDYLLNLKIAYKLLQHHGATVFTASNGQEALDWLQDRANHVDVVLMDIQMPIMDGNTAVAKLRATGKFDTLPVVGLTGGAMLSEREKSLQAGMNDYLTKPLNPDQMIRVIRQLVEQVRKGQTSYSTIQE